MHGKDPASTGPRYEQLVFHHPHKKSYQAATNQGQVGTPFRLMEGSSMGPCDVYKGFFKGYPAAVETVLDPTSQTKVRTSVRDPKASRCLQSCTAPGHVAKPQCRWHSGKLPNMRILRGLLLPAQAMLELRLGFPRGPCIDPNSRALIKRDPPICGNSQTVMADISCKTQRRLAF